jgi:hypothetical protein
MTTHVPSLAALESDDDARLAAELRLASLRLHAAVLGALADHIDAVADPTDIDDLRERLVEEKARFGCMEAELSQCLEESRVFVVRGSTRSAWSKGVRSHSRLTFAPGPETGDKS